MGVVPAGGKIAFQEHAVFIPGRRLHAGRLADLGHPVERKPHYHALEFLAQLNYLFHVAPRECEHDMGAHAKPARLVEKAHRPRKMSFSSDPIIVGAQSFKAYLVVQRSLYRDETFQHPARHGVAQDG